VADTPGAVVFDGNWMASDTMGNDCYYLGRRSNSRVDFEIIRDLIPIGRLEAVFVY
jgi:hypothetical protein